MRRGVKTTVVGGLLILSSIVVPFLFIIPEAIRQSEDAEAFPVPGKMTVTLDDPGEYYVWSHNDAPMKGPTTTPNYIIMDEDITVIDSDGKDVVFVENISFSIERPGSEKQSIGTFRIDQPATVAIEVPAEYPEMSLSVSRLSASRFLNAMGYGILIAGVIGLAGLGLLIWGIVKLASGKREVVAA